MYNDSVQEYEQRNYASQEEGTNNDHRSLSNLYSKLPDKDAWQASNSSVSVQASKSSVSVSEDEKCLSSLKDFILIINLINWVVILALLAASVYHFIFENPRIFAGIAYGVTALAYFVICRFEIAVIRWMRCMLTNVKRIADKQTQN